MPQPKHPMIAALGPGVRHLALALLLASMAALAPLRAGAAERGMAGGISRSEFEEVLKGDVAVVLDVRLDGECREVDALLRDALHEPFEMRPPGTEEAEMADEDFLARVLSHDIMHAALAAKRPVLIVCCLGIKSATVATLLAERGYYALHLVEGMVKPDAATDTPAQDAAPDAAAPKR